MNETLPKWLFGQKSEGEQAADGAAGTGRRRDASHGRAGGEQRNPCGDLVHEKEQVAGPVWAVCKIDFSGDDKITPSFRRKQCEKRQNGITWETNEPNTNSQEVIRDIILIQPKPVDLCSQLEEL